MLEMFVPALLAVPELLAVPTFAPLRALNRHCRPALARGAAAQSQP